MHLTKMYNAIIRTTPNSNNVCDYPLCELWRRQFKMTSSGGEPDDSILLKESVIHGHHVFKNIWTIVGRSSHVLNKCSSNGKARSGITVHNSAYNQSLWYGIWYCEECKLITYFWNLCMSFAFTTACYVYVYTIKYKGHIQSMHVTRVNFLTYTCTLLIMIVKRQHAHVHIWLLAPKCPNIVHVNNEKH